jgi:hypothetical protein
MSDADYEAFLNKANSGTGDDADAEVTATSYGTKSVNTQVPQVLEGVQEYYTSEADEPFEPVALNFDGDGGISARKFYSISYSSCFISTSFCCCTGVLSKI